MQSSPRVAMMAPALVLALSSFTSVAWADKAEVASAAAMWAETIGDPDKISSLYSEDAVLWGTLSPKFRSGRAAVREYFVAVAKVTPGIKLDFGDQSIRVYGNAAVNTGTYTFSWVKDGETKTLPARYSFAYVKDGDRWLIVDHHSSPMPSPPK
jgi:uncharacterized protein (TIGR02246 family)